MGNKKSSLSNPLWKSKSSGNKLHPVSIKHFISLKMIIAFIYDLTSYNVNTKSYEVSDELKNLANFERDFLNKLKTELKWSGLNYFESLLDEINEESDRYRAAEKFARKKFSKWFNDNAKNFIMEE
jgi:hypothetical protein